MFRFPKPALTADAAAHRLAGNQANRLARRSSSSPCGHVRATASYFRAGHLLLDSLTYSLQLEQEIQALELPGREGRPAIVQQIMARASAASQQNQPG